MAAVAAASLESGQWSHQGPARFFQGARAPCLPQIPCSNRHTLQWLRNAPCLALNSARPVWLDACVRSASPDKAIRCVPVASSPWPELRPPQAQLLSAILLQWAAAPAPGRWRRRVIGAAASLCRFNRAGARPVSTPVSFRILTDQLRLFAFAQAPTRYCLTTVHHYRVSRKAFLGRGESISCRTGKASTIGARFELSTDAPLLKAYQSPKDSHARQNSPTWTN